MSTTVLPQAHVFGQLRLAIFRNSLATWRQNSPMRLVTIMVCSVLVWLGVFIASGLGFLFLRLNQIPFAGGIIGTLFDLLFLALSMMLVFSTGIILYSSLFSAPETSFLLTTPAHADQIFAYKFQGALAFSSWAFILLGSPILIAYGLVFGVPWHFYLLLPLFFLGFTLVPGSIGALGCLLVVNFVPKRKQQLVIVLGVASVILAAYATYRVSHAAREALQSNPDALQRLLTQLSFSKGPLVPSHWMTRGLEASARGEFAQALYPLALIWSNGLFFYLVCAAASRVLYRRGYNRTRTGGDLRRRYGGHWMDRLFGFSMGFLHKQTQLLIIKDFRTFRRDPAQWGQVLLFFGLIVFYTANTRRFYNEDIGKGYQSGISLLNVAATAFLMCAYTGRFIYPMLSLEGRKFWILGLLPLERDRLLRGKFAFSAIGAIAIALLLVVTSDLLLGVGWVTLALHAFTVIVLALGLSGLSVGLGACLPNFRESDPSKVAVGFGGTLNLVVGLLFLLVTIALMGLPYHIFLAASGPDGPAFKGRIAYMLCGILGGTVTGAAAVILPLRAGSRALKRMEF